MRVVGCAQRSAAARKRTSVYSAVLVLGPTIPSTLQTHVHIPQTPTLSCADANSAGLELLRAAVEAVRASDIANCFEILDAVQLTGTAHLIHMQAARTVRRRLDWKLRTAVSVAGPKLPSTAPGLKPLDASRFCRLVTHVPAHIMTMMSRLACGARRSGHRRSPSAKTRVHQPAVAAAT
jgi:hypothetical protein